MKNPLRLFFLLLVLANVLLFAFGQGYLGKFGIGSEPERLSAQIDPGKMKLLSTGAPPKVQVPPIVEICRLYVGSTETSQRLKTTLREADSIFHFNSRTQREPATWWVILPNLKTRAVADRKAQELAALGIRDYQVVPIPDSTRFVVSLGLYKTEEAAKKALTRFTKKKVRSAKVALKNAASEKVFLEVRGPEDRLLKALKSLPEGFGPDTFTQCKEES